MVQRACLHYLDEPYRLYMANRSHGQRNNINRGDEQYLSGYHRTYTRLPLVLTTLLKHLFPMLIIGLN